MAGGALGDGFDWPLLFTGGAEEVAVVEAAAGNICPEMCYTRIEKY